MKIDTEKRGPAGTEGRLPQHLLDHVEVSLDTFVGSARMTVGAFSELSAGETITLDSPLNQAVELRLNGTVVGRGELVAVGDRFGVRLTEVAG